MKLSTDQLAATAITDNLVVNAGAGSGKTTVLITRYMRLLEEGGLQPSEVVAITFTKKAAREMRERIDSELGQRTETGESKWKLARDQLVSAPISTIHAFYARILRTFPVEAGIDPSFRVLDELDADLMLSQALGELLQEAQENKCPNLAVLSEVLGAGAIEEEGSLAAQLREIYKTLLNRGIPVGDARLSGMYGSLTPWQQSRDNYLEIIAINAEISASLAAEGKDRPEMQAVRRALAAAGPIVGAIGQARELMDLYDYLVPLTNLTGGRTKGHKEFVKTTVEQLQLLLSQGLAPILGDATLALLLRLDQIFKGIKAQAQGLDYADLQFAVWRLLKSNSDVVRKLRSRYKTYMIDEFQDTDRLQHQIVMMLVEEQGTIPPGRLFVVGDEKQSIYRFRGAEVRVFDEVRQQLTKERERHIKRNYRSRQPLIDLVNCLFSPLMDKAQGSEIDYIDLTAHREGQGPCAEMIKCLVQGDDDTPAEAEARTLAARIRAMVEGRQELAADRDDKPRPVEYKDIAVLVRARTHLGEYEHQLRIAGVPYTVVGGIGFYQQQEVVDIINLLKVISNLREQLALAAVLRSPLFGLDDDSLLALGDARRKQGGILLDHGSCLPAEQEDRLTRARGIINQLRAARGRLEIPRLLELALDLTRFREVALARFAGLQRYANLEKLVEMARQFSASGNHNLIGFLQWLDHSAHRNEAEAQVDSEESNSVRILTIHASKGLEFPVVFLPVCSSKLIVRPGSILVDSQGELAFKHPWKCPVWEQYREQEKTREHEEFKRLLYVATTRARDWLVTLVQEPEQTGTSFNIWLQEFAYGNPDHFERTDDPESAENLSMPSPLPKPGPPPDWEPQQVFTGLTPVGHGNRTFRYFSISQFMLWQQSPEEFERLYLSRWVDCAPIGQREQQQDRHQEPGGAVFGSLLHDALEVMTPDTDIDALLQDLIPRHYGDADQRDQILFSAGRLLKQGQRDPGPPGNFNCKDNEMEFYYRLGDVLFYGLIDQVLVADDHIAVLDFKTNRIPPEGIKPLVQAYSPQIMFYAMAAEEIYKRPARGYLKLLRMEPGEQTVEIPASKEKFDVLKKELQCFIDFCNAKGE